jgi:CheY-like chemotaxis protein
VQSCRRPSILIVEDDALIALGMKEMLEFEMEAAVYIASSADEAMAALCARVDFAVLDVNVICGDTFQLARHLAAIPIPFAFVTAYRQIDMPEDLRCFPFFSKPYSEGSLLRTVRSYIGG